jgi:SAM-dependent methyltransferase
VWQQKPVLRSIYIDEFFSRLLAYRNPGGTSIEVGGGPGLFKQFSPGVLCTDLISSPWLDAVADAQCLPFRSCSVNNVFGLDMLHHLAKPMLFLAEAQRVLVPGGRLILVEPWITPFSYLVYRFFHQEGCDLAACPWDTEGLETGTTKAAFDGNPAIPYLLFQARSRRRTLADLPHMSPVAVEPFCLFAYLLSFGFKRPNLLPHFLYRVFSIVERKTLPIWRRLAALRVVLVLEKRPA